MVTETDYYYYYIEWRLKVIQTWDAGGQEAQNDPLGQNEGGVPYGSSGVGSISWSFDFSDFYFVSFLPSFLSHCVALVGLELITYNKLALNS